MALFDDGFVSCMEDLTARDSQLTTVASVEGIDVSQKLMLAQNELAIELTALLVRTWNSNSPFQVEAGRTLSQVVVTPPLKIWHTARTLELVYADAFNSQLNDRYRGKEAQFQGLGRRAYDQLLQIGVGISSNPVARSASPRVGSGGGALPPGTYYVTSEWVNAQGEQGAAAEPVVVTTTGETFTVSLSAASPPMSGWNVYVGDSGPSMVRQNVGLLMPDDIWTQPDPVVTTGAAPSDGQKPNYLLPQPRIGRRG